MELLKEKSIPDYLYHYTNLSALEAILDTRSIKFNSLENMDDMEEAETGDLNHIGKYLYVSSWADDGEYENIAMWGLYSQNYSGIRIKMRTDPFVSSIVQLPYYEGKTARIRFAPDILEKYSLYLYPTLPFVRRVQYSSKQEKLHPLMASALHKNIDGTYNLKANLNELGLYKRTEWKVQNEVRYSFCLLPHNVEGGLKIDVDPGLKETPFPCCFVSLSEEGVDSTEITLGPCVSKEDQEIVYALMEKHFPHDYQRRIHRSVVKIKKP